MTSADLLGVLAETTVAASAAIGAVFLLRRPLRRWFGPAVGYAAWGMVPIAVLAVCLPAMTASVVEVASLDPVGMVVAAAIPSVSAMGASPGWLVVVWACGAIAMAARLVLQQRAFVRSLGELRPWRDGAFQARVVAGLPAVLGLLRPRMVLPADFETRYSPEQQVLLRLHEREHLAHGDLWANALVAALRCVSWFNPLVHVAAGCFRHDQELACDQRVLASRPGSRRAYGEAMVNTQLATQPLPLGCHWGFGHPLKERIAMLKQPLPSRRRWMAGTTLVAVLAGSAGIAAWAAQPSGARSPVEGTPGADVAPASVDSGSRILQPPKYPAGAVAQGVSGKVVLLIDIDAQGHPTAVTVERAEPAGVFETEAAAAAWKWKFTPAIENGRAVSSQVRVPVHFEADGTPPGDQGSAPPDAMATTRG